MGGADRLYGHHRQFHGAGAGPMPGGHLICHGDDVHHVRPTRRDVRHRPLAEPVMELVFLCYWNFFLSGS
ncbi:hypothetical protein [Arthrobacter sp. E3]|uniref:hypothetical protein n=1 Tax=Arthrobacter sp. E3 TaxID=517402 RepID=UPI001A94ED69|nr:hypothetical protein [Arthrobacter sp. E3]